MIYTVMQGDTLSSIAKRFNTTVSALLALNPQIINPDTIFPGQIIRVSAEVPTPPTPVCPLLQRGRPGQ